MANAAKPQIDSARESVSAIDAEFGARLKAARDDRQLSQSAVATRSKWADAEGKGISRTALIGYEAGTSRPGTRELRILCTTLAVSPNRLLFGTEAPLQTAHVALEGLGEAAGRGLRQAIELAFVLAALRGHERDALMSLALSFAGRQLGDVRLAGLRALAHLTEPKIAAAILPDVASGAPGEALEDIVERLSQGQGANIGTNLRFEDDGETPIGTPLYPEPGMQRSKQGKESD
jgi:transcriptional regulator with XRE-family HTH domain